MKIKTQKKQSTSNERTTINPPLKVESQTKNSNHEKMDFTEFKLSNQPATLDEIEKVIQAEMQGTNSPESRILILN